jgi:hypothetical protein
MDLISSSGQTSLSVWGEDLVAMHDSTINLFFTQWYGSFRQATYRRFFFQKYEVGKSDGEPKTYHKRQAAKHPYIAREARESRIFKEHFGALIKRAPTIAQRQAGSGRRKVAGAPEVTELGYERLSRIVRMVFRQNHILLVKQHEMCVIEWIQVDNSNFSLA